MRKPLVEAAAVIVAAGSAVAAPAVVAAPAGFPDVDAFTPVDSRDYLTGELYRFLTPNGRLFCSWHYVRESLANPLSSPDILCNGDVPGMPDSVPDTGGPGCAKVTAIPFHTTEFAFDRHGGYCPPVPGSIATLAAGQKIETGDATCVVGDGNLVACIEPIQDHGFVLQPSGSWVF